jgi:hypothetical protein
VTKKVTNRQKYFLLIAGIAIFLLFLCLNVFKKTYWVYTENRRLSLEIAKARNAPEKLIKAKAMMSQSNDMAQDQNADIAINTHEKLLDIISHYCAESKISLISYPEPITIHENGFSNEINVFTVQGDFKKLLMLLYILEQKDKIGKVSSADFKTSKNYETKKFELTCTIYIQTFKKETHD